MRDVLKRLARILPLSACLAASPVIHPDSVDLHLERAVFLEYPEVLNLSAVAIDSTGRVFFADDRGPTPPDWQPENPVLLAAGLDSLLHSGSGVVRLHPVGPARGAFDFAALAQKAGKVNKYDLEGLCLAPGGKLWAVDERDRLLLEFDPSAAEIGLVAGPEVLLRGQEDLLAAGLNTSFEGVARLGNRLFIAHEMRPAVVLVYRLDRGLELEKRIEVADSPDLTDLCVDRGRLYALGRMRSEVYKIDPESGRILAVASFKTCADSLKHRYVNQREEYRNSEGLGLTDGVILVALDGNLQTLRQSDERRPLLFIFPRPKGF
ncbi:esterase-like activity of phytase family protein [bacterium]|nr:esterase-like activity of phytase family protein [bacterium]